MKAVPGRKTDVRGAEWIAQLLEHGLLTPSFVPPPAIRRLRLLTRYRIQLQGDRTREIVRLELMLEDASIKLSTVASSPKTVSARGAGNRLDVIAVQVPVTLASAIMRSRRPSGRDCAGWSPDRGADWNGDPFIEAASPAEPANPS